MCISNVLAVRVSPSGLPIGPSRGALQPTNMKSHRRTPPQARLPCERRYIGVIFLDTNSRRKSPGLAFGASRDVFGFTLNGTTVPRCVVSAT